MVYGKAPGFYEELSDLIGEEALLGALRSYVEANAFAIATPEDLRGALRAAAPGRAEEVDALWVRWLEQAHGDEDIGTGAPLGAPALWVGWKVCWAAPAPSRASSEEATRLRSIPPSWRRC